MITEIKLSFYDARFVVEACRAIAPNIKPIEYIRQRADDLMITFEECVDDMITEGSELAISKYEKLQRAMDSVNEDQWLTDNY